MLSLKQARNKLKAVGTSKAEGDALRFMYANLTAFQACLSTKANSVDWPISEIYEELGTYPDDKIREGFYAMNKKWCPTVDGNVS